MLPSPIASDIETELYAESKTEEDVLAIFEAINADGRVPAVHIRDDLRLAAERARQARLALPHQICPQTRIVAKLDREIMATRSVSMLVWCKALPQAMLQLEALRPDLFPSASEGPDEQAPVERDDAAQPEAASDRRRPALSLA